MYFVFALTYSFRKLMTFTTRHVADTLRAELRVNPLSQMPILGSSNSTGNKDMIGKYMDKWG